MWITVARSTGLLPNFAEWKFIGNDCFQLFLNVEMHFECHFKSDANKNTTLVGPFVWFRHKNFGKEQEEVSKK